MVIYIIIWGLLLLSCLISKRSIALYLLWLIILVFLAGGRDITVGIDTRHYKEMFEIAGGGTFEAWVEPLWSLFGYLYYNFVSSDFNAFLFAVSLIALSILFYVSYKESPNPVFSIFIYYSLHWYTASYNIMRQHFAAPIVLLSWYYLHQDKKYKSLIILAIAYGFHDSSIFALIVFLWIKCKLTLRRIFILLLVSFVIGSIINENLMFEILPSFLMYFLNKDHIFRDNLPLILTLVFCQNLMVACVLKCIPKSMLNNFWFKIFILSCAVFNATYMIAYAARIYTVFAMCQVIAFPLIISSATKYKRFFVTFLLLGYLSAQFFRILLNDQNGLIPYVNVFLN